MSVQPWKPKRQHFVTEIGGDRVQIGVLFNRPPTVVAVSKRSKPLTDRSLGFRWLANGGNLSCKMLDSRKINSEIDCELAARSNICTARLDINYQPVLALTPMPIAPSLPEAMQFQKVNQAELDNLIDPLRDLTHQISLAIKSEKQLDCSKYADCHEKRGASDPRANG
jgi:hypothetical protein